MQGLIYSVTKLHATFLTFTCNGLTLISTSLVREGENYACQDIHTTTTMECFTPGLP